MKNRQLNKKKYYKVLLAEWVSCFLRSLTNKRTKEREYWKKVSLMKVEKILSLSEELLIYHPFNSEEEINDFIKENLYDKKTNLPRFHYRDADDIEQYRLSDLFGFYNRGTKVTLIKPIDTENNEWEVMWFEINSLEIKNLKTGLLANCLLSDVRREIKYED